MKKLRLSELLTDLLVLAGIFVGLAGWWRDIEIWLYGYSQESTVDAIICIIISLWFTRWLSKWRNFKEDDKNENIVSEAN